MKKQLYRILGTTLLLMGLVANPMCADATFIADSPAVLDGMIYIPYPELPEFCSISVPISSLTDAQIMERFYVERQEEIDGAYWYPISSYIDADIWHWWITNDIGTSQEKFEVFNSTNPTSNEVFWWVITNIELSDNQKLDYVRTHSIQYTDDVIKTWWWDNVGSKLKIGETTILDHQNMSYYRRALYGTADGNLISVKVEERFYYMEPEAVEKCVESGKIREELHTIYICDDPSTATYTNKYYSNVGLNTGYMMW